MNVPAIVASQLWELGGTEAYEPFFHDITLLCVALTRDGLMPNGISGWAMRDAICEILAEDSLTWRGRQGRDAHGIWRAPDGGLVWWTNSDVGSAWCYVQDVARGTLDRLLLDADPLLIEEVNRTGYRRWAA